MIKVNTQKVNKQLRSKLSSDLQQIDSRYHSDRSWREYVIAHPSEFSTYAVDRMQSAEDEAAPLRAELAAIDEE